VLIPAKELDRAKGRLESLLTPAEREQLALATLSTVLRACAGAELPVAVLTRDPRVIAALPPGVEVLLEDPSRAGLNAQLERALALLGGDDLLILHADLPLASPEALAQLLAGGRPSESVVLVRSRDGGTTAMRMRPPGRFPLQYGRSSFAAHVAAASGAGLEVTQVELPALALDLDTVDDLHTLLGSVAGSATPSGELLRAFAIPERLVDL